MEKDVLAWIDVETTGLNPNTDKLLQVSTIFTDVEGNRLPGHDLDFLVGYTEAEVEEMKVRCDPYVLKIHERTGLWEAIVSPFARPLWGIDEWLSINISIASNNNPKKVRLAGNSVRLDLNFLEVYLPKTYASLHYRSVDVSALAYVFHEVYGVDYYEKRKTHNALDDIKESLEEYRYLLQHVYN